jgi:hypothetical protein
VRSIPKTQVILADLLFVSPVSVDQITPEATVTAVHEVSSLLGPDGADRAASEVAYAYGDRPETAAPRMAACLAAVTVAFGHLPVPAPRPVTR